MHKPRCPFQNLFSRGVHAARKPGVVLTRRPPKLLESQGRVIRAGGEQPICLPRRRLSCRLAAVAADRVPGIDQNGSELVIADAGRIHRPRRRLGCFSQRQRRHQVLGDQLLDVLRHVLAGGARVPSIGIPRHSEGKSSKPCSLLRIDCRNLLGIQRFAALGHGRPDKLIQLRPWLVFGDDLFPPLIAFARQQKPRKIRHLRALRRRQLLAKAQQFLGFAAHGRILPAGRSISASDRSLMVRVGPHPPQPLARSAPPAYNFA